MVKLKNSGLISDANIVLVDASGTALYSKQNVIAGMQVGDISANNLYHPTFVRKGVTGVYEHYVNSAFTYNPQTNTLSAGNITAESSATSSVINTNNAIDIVYPTFVCSGNFGSLPLNANNNLKYNQSTNTLSANISGIANKSDTVSSKNKNQAEGDYYISFVSASADEYCDIFKDQSLKYNPKSGVLSAKFFSGNCTGTITGSVDSATTAEKTNIAEITGSIDTTSYYPTFVTGTAASGAHSYDKDFYYTTHNNTIHAAIFSGKSNTCITADTSIATTVTALTTLTDTAQYYPTFVSAGSGDHKYNTRFYYRLDNDTLYAGNFNGNFTATKTNPAIAAASTIYNIGLINRDTSNITVYSGLSFTTATNTLTSGKFNASGSDFAEYMTKKNGSFQFEAGDICGIDRNGLLTNIFSESFHFCVKSKNPAIIAKGNEEKSELTEAIAFCGQVPVNVFHCRVGDYIVPIESEGGMISGTNISSASISFGQYKDSIGKVIRINADGTAEIIVKIV